MSNIPLDAPVEDMQKLLDKQKEKGTRIISPTLFFDLVCTTKRSFSGKIDWPQCFFYAYTCCGERVGCHCSESEKNRMLEQKLAELNRGLGLFDICVKCRQLSAGSQRITFTRSVRYSEIHCGVLFVIGIIVARLFVFGR